VALARVALPVAAEQAFDYWAPDGLDVRRGSIVRVRLGPRPLVGVVVETPDAGDAAHERLQPIAELVDLPVLPDDVMDLAAFVASYYQDATGLAHALLVPPLPRTSRATRPPAAALPTLRLTREGRDALAAGALRSPLVQRLLDCFAPADLLDAQRIARLTAPQRARLRQWLAEGRVVDASRLDVGERIALNDAQRSAADAIGAARGTFAPFLLEGVTGSGKSEVYFEAIERARAVGLQTLLLVPEINLTPQLDARVAKALPGVRAVTLHSGLADGARRRNWVAAARGDADLVLGTRLSVFVPLPRLGLIVVDEEHDASYKQQEGVRYHARDAALWRGRRRGVPVVLGSATPSLESTHAARSGRYGHLILDRRADPRAALPGVRLVPASAEDVREGISAPLWLALAERLARGEQSLVFVNRRGFAPSLKCVACGWEAGCPHCSARLTLHRAPSGLRCHHCGRVERVPAACPSCGNVDLLPRGHGTQRLEQALAAGLPGARVVRVDRDTTRRRSAFAGVRRDVEANAIDVLVGTQMLAKGHDFPRLTLVGVLGADNALYSADFRATERLAALLMQVAGRAGRAELPGEVIVQTDFPRHPVFASLVTHDYRALVDQLLDERRIAGLPPFSRLALLVAEATGRADVDAFLERAYGAARELARGTTVEVFAPVAATMAKRAGYERGQMLLRNPAARELGRVLAGLRATLVALGARRVRWAIDVDPDTVS
jgi:primosomal protein N' (replication factor Y)